MHKWFEETSAGTGLRESARLIGGPALGNRRTYAPSGPRSSRST